MVEEEEEKEKKKKEEKKEEKNRVPSTVDRFFYTPFFQTGILAQNPKVTQIYCRGILKKKIIFFPIHIEVRGGIIYDERA